MDCGIDLGFGRKRILPAAPWPSDPRNSIFQLAIPVQESAANVELFLPRPFADKILVCCSKIKQKMKKVSICEHIVFQAFMREAYPIQALKSLFCSPRPRRNTTIADYIHGM